MAGFKSSNNQVYLFALLDPIWLRVAFILWQALLSGQVSGLSDVVTWQLQIYPFRLVPSTERTFSIMAPEKVLTDSDSQLVQLGSWAHLWIVPKLAKLGHMSFPAAGVMAGGKQWWDQHFPPLPEPDSHSRENYRPLPEKGGTGTRQAEATVFPLEQE